jgi:hypothetical protein
MINNPDFVGETGVTGGQALFEPVAGQTRPHVFNKGSSSSVSKQVSGDMNARKTASVIQEKKRKAKAKSKVKTGTNNQTETKSTSFTKGVQDAGQKGLEESGGGAMDTAGSALMMSGNPYAMAAGGAMKVIGQVKAKREAQAQKRANDENNRRKNLQTALANLGSGIGSIGMA